MSLEHSPVREAGNRSGNIGRMLVSDVETAALLGCSSRTLERHRLEGTGIPFVPLGRLVRSRLLDVRQHLERYRRTSTSDTRLEGERW